MQLTFIPRVFVLPSFLTDDFGTEIQVVPPGAEELNTVYRTEVSLDAFCYALSYGMNEL